MACSSMMTVHVLWARNIDIVFVLRASSAVLTSNIVPVASVAEVVIQRMGRQMSMMFGGAGRPNGACEWRGASCGAGDERHQGPGSLGPPLVDRQRDEVALGGPLAIWPPDHGPLLTKHGPPKPLVVSDAVVVATAVVVGAIFWAGVVMLFFGTWR